MTPIKSKMNPLGMPNKSLSQLGASTRQWFPVTRNIAWIFGKPTNQSGVCKTPIPRNPVHRRCAGNPPH